MGQPDSLLDLLVAALQRAGNYNRIDQTPPATILWADRGREWASLVPRLRERLPVLTLGPYAPEQSSGPMAWLRCVVARTLPGSPAAEALPVLYLPGLSGDDLREPDTRTPELKALVDLIYRSATWCRPDGHDWTIATFLADKAAGPGVEVRIDADTSKAMQRALIQIADLPTSRLREDAPWRAADFDALIGYHERRKETDVRQLIAQGESGELEFKSTARWDVVKAQKNAAMEQIIVKSVAGFLNSTNGGTLLIGVRDNGAIHGLDDDYQVWSDLVKRNKDQYELWLMGMLTRAYGPEFAPYINATFYVLDGKELCKVTVYAAPKPAFFQEKEKTGETNDVFYARIGNATNRLNHRALVEYIRLRWKNYLG